MQRLVLAAFAFSVGAAHAAPSIELAGRARAAAALEGLAQLSGEAPLVAWSRRGDVPAAISGRLSTPSSEAPEAVARAFLRANADLLRANAEALVRTRTFTLPDGLSVVRYTQRHQGLPVFGSAAAVMIDGRGVVRALVARTHALEPQSTRARVDAMAALRRAQAETFVAGHTDDVRRATLGFLRSPGAMHLAWRVELPAVPSLLSAPTVYVDADDGRILRRVSRLFFAKRGKVYRQNPVVTTSVELVDFPWLADGATTLEGTRVRAVNCIDRHTTQRVSFGTMSFNVHLCEEDHKATADASGDFVFDPVTTSPGRDEDEFAEQMMFFHANRTYDFYRSLGFDTLVPSVGTNAQLRATANFRIPVDINNIGGDLLGLLAQVTNPNGTLYPFDNAFFLAAEEAGGFLQRDVDSLVFGQGTGADFAYDGDVVAHEFGHAVIRTTAGLNEIVVDEFGTDGAPLAMNEGYADYFSAAQAGDPNVGEYAAQSLPQGMLAGSIRTLDNTATCPGGLWGESHNDSQPFTGALWEARSTLASTRRGLFDRAAFAALITLNGSSTFEEAATATVAAINTGVGNLEAAATQSIFTRRGLMGCNHRIITDSTTRHLAMVEGTGTVTMDPFVPGYTQIKVRTSATSTRLAVSWTKASSIVNPQSGLGGLFGGGPDLRILISEGSPIQFVYGSAGDTIENALDYPELTPTSATTGNGETLSGTFDGRANTDYYVMLVNRGQGQGLARELKVEVRAAAADGGVSATDGGMTGAGGDGGVSVGDGGTSGSTADGGSISPAAKGGGCSTAGGADLASVFALLAILGACLALRRRSA